MSDEFQRYRSWLLALSLGGFAVLVGMNLVVDPFRALGTFRWSHGLEPYRVNGTRKAKAERLTAGGWGTVILGSSRAEMGFSPSDDVWSSSPVYNAGLSGTNLIETGHVVRTLVQTQPPKMIFLPVSLLMFGQGRRFAGDFADSRFNPELDKFSYWVGNAIGEYASLESARTLFLAARNKPRAHRPDGLRQRSLPQPPRQRALVRTVIERFMTQTETYNGYVFGEDRVEALRSSLADSLDRGTSVVLVVPPVHALQLETIRVMGLWDEYEEMKRVLTELVAELSARSKQATVEVWDFGTYSSYATERVPPETEPDREMQWYYESSHFKDTLGRRVLERVLRCKQADQEFGVLLRRSNIESHLAQIREDRARYADAVPAEIAWVEQLFEGTKHARVRQARIASTPAAEAPE